MDDRHRRRQHLLHAVSALSAHQHAQQERHRRRRRFHLAVFRQGLSEEILSTRDLGQSQDFRDRDADHRAAGHAVGLHHVYREDPLCQRAANPDSRQLDERAVHRRLRVDHALRPQRNHHQLFVEYIRHQARRHLRFQGLRHRHELTAVFAGVHVCLRRVQEHG